MVDAYYSQLMNISIVMNKTLLLRTYFDETEKHLPALQSLEENNEQRQLLYNHTRRWRPIITTRTSANIPSLSESTRKYTG